MNLPVAHHPPDHPYTRRLPGRRETPSTWHPPALAAQGIRIVHLHFGFETCELAQLSTWIDELHAHRIRLVYTAHDLDNPHLTDQRRHRQLLELIVASADHVLTLTRHAARRLALIGAAATVVPHPHVVPLHRMLRRRRRSSGPIYVHAATCRPNLDVELLVQAAERLAAVAELLVHLRLPLDEHRDEVAARLSPLPGVTLDLADRLSDAQLWDRIERASAIMLPYRWGTRSGLLEAGRDLATPVLVAPISTLIEQGATALDLDDAVGSFERCRQQPPVSVIGRLRERQNIVETHRRIYRDLLGAA